MEVDLSSNPKAIQQIEFVGQFKNTDIEIFVLTILENFRNEIKVFWRKFSITINNDNLSRNTCGKK